MDLARTFAKATIVFGVAALCAGLSTSSGTGKPSVGASMLEPAAVMSGKGDRLRSGARSGLEADVRTLGENTTVVERPMTDRERIEAAFAASRPSTALASRF